MGRGRTSKGRRATDRTLRNRNCIHTRIRGNRSHRRHSQLFGLSCVDAQTFEGRKVAYLLDW